MTTPLTPIPARVPDLRGDVSQIAPADGDTLVWVASTSQWTPTAVVVPTVPVASVFGRTGAIIATAGDYVVSLVTGAAPLDSPAFTGTPTAPTAAPGDSDTSVANTAFVAAAVAAKVIPVPSVFGRTGAIFATAGDYTVAQVTGAAPLASPAFTGNPTAPTPAPGDNDTSIATAAFVTAGFARLTGAAQTVSAPTSFSGNICAGEAATPLTALDVRGVTIAASPIANNVARPPLSTARIQGEISNCGSGGTPNPILAADDGFMRLSAGGGSFVTSKTAIDIAGFSTLGAVSNTIVFYTSGLEQARILANGNINLGSPFGGSAGAKLEVTPTTVSSNIAAFYTNGGVQAVVIGQTGTTFAASPIVPTPTAGDSSTKAANTAFVTGAVATLSSSVTTSLSAKAPLAAPVFTTSLVLPTSTEASIPNGGIAESTDNPGVLKYRTRAGVLKTITLT